MSSEWAFALQARLFLFYAKYLWRFKRRFVRSNLQRRCKLCAISEAFSKLDEARICGECRKPKNVQDAYGDLPALESQLHSLLQKSQGAGPGQYDALVLLSGGKDSALIVHELKQRYPGLRMVAVFLDNSFMSPIAIRNVQQVAEKLDVDLVTLKLKRSVYKKTFRFAVSVKEAHQGCFETVDRMDADLGFSQSKIFAATHQIPLIVSGLSWDQVERLFQVKSFEIPAENAFKKIDKALGKPLETVYSKDELKYWWDPKRSNGYQGHFIHPFYVWRFDESEIQKKVAELGLISRGRESPLVTNGQVIALMLMADYLRLGYGSFEPEFANQIRHGKAEYQLWRNVFEMLEYSAKTGWMIKATMRQVAKSLELDLQDLAPFRW